eukprot:405247-Pleurochrysis_carterae.AAC.2
MRDVHDNVAQKEKQTRRERFREEVREVVGAAEEGHRELELLHLFADEEMPTMNVLGARMVLRVVGEVNRRLVV